MSQHDFDIANQGFAAFRADLNNALKALGSLSSGTAEPATTYANQLWYETDTNTLHIRNEANSAWLDLMVIDQSTGSPSFTAGNVGIGTSSPSKKLHLAGTAGSSAILLAKTDSGASTLGQIGFSTVNGTVAGIDATAVTDSNNGALRFWTTGGSPQSDVTSLSERARIDASGRLLIGTSTSPSSSLVRQVVSGDGAYSQWSRAATTIAGAFAGTDGNGLIFGTHTGAVGSETYTERARIDSSGNVGIGTATPVAKLTVAMDTASLSVGNLSTDVAQIGVSSVSDSIAFGQFVSGGATFDEKARITASGNLLVGTTGTPSGSANGVMLSASGQGIFSRSAAASLLLYRPDSNGNIAEFYKGSTNVGSISVTGTATAYNTSSDYRLKEDVQPMVGASDRVLALKPVNFAWKADGSRTDGFIAHEVQEVAPYAVLGEKDGEEMQAMDHSKLVPLLTAALQEALTKIKALEARITALEA